MNTNGILRNKTAFIVGGTAGIGKVIARQMALAGARVILNGRNSEKGEAAVQEFRSAGLEASYVQADATKPGGLEGPLKAMKASWPHIDILVTSGAAEGYHPKPFAQMNIEEVQRVFETRLFSRLYAMYAMLPFMKERGGSIVALTTDAGRVPTAGESMNGAAAAALLFSARALAKELARDNIRVNCLSLTLTKHTPIYENFLNDKDDQQQFITKVFKKIEASAPFGLPEPDDIAQAAVFLASDQAAKITGGVLSINGGMSFP